MGETAKVICEKMKEETIAENENYFVKMIEDPNLDDFSNFWKKLQANCSLYMTFESVSSYVKNYGNIGKIILFFLEGKNNKSIDAIFPLRVKNYFLYKKFFFLPPRIGFNYNLLSSSIDTEIKNFFLRSVFDTIVSSNSIVFLGPLHQGVIDDINKNIDSTRFKSIQIDFSEHLYVLDLPASFQDLLNSFDRKFRKNLRYYQRKVEKDFVVTFSNIRNLKENISSYEDFLTLHKSLIKNKGFITPFEYKPFRDYIFDLVSEFEDTGGIFSMKLNDNIACIILYVDWENTRYFLNLGISPNYKKYSVARLLIAHVIEDAINKGMKYFDFGQGDEEYKEEWGCQKFQNKTIIIFSNKFLYLVDSFIDKIFDTIRHVMRMPILQFPKKVWMNLYLKKR